MKTQDELITALSLWLIDVKALQKKARIEALNEAQSDLEDALEEAEAEPDDDEAGEEEVKDVEPEDEGNAD